MSLGMFLSPSKQFLAVSRNLLLMTEAPQKWDMVPSLLDICRDTCQGY